MQNKPNVVVIGGSYVGLKAAQELASRIHASHNTVVVEKNSHIQHLFAFPRITVAGGFEHKAFIPYTNAFADSPPNSTSVVRGTVTRISPDQVVLDSGDVIPYEYLVLATGMGAPGAYVSGEKHSGIDYFQNQQKLVEKADHITIIGGGAYGVQVATDIKVLLPSKKVTIIHSRDHLMNRFHPKLHTIVSEKLDEYGIEVVLNQRVNIPEDGFPTDRRFEIPLADGKTLQTDLAIVCIGPQSAKAVPILSTLVPSLTSVPVPVKPTLQIDSAEHPRIFAVGDVADTTAAKAARPGVVQAAIVAENIAKMIEAGANVTENDLKTFEAPVPGIHLYLGVRDSIIFRNPPSETEEPSVVFKDDGKLEMGCTNLWERWAKGNQNYMS